MGTPNRQEDNSQTSGSEFAIGADAVKAIRYCKPHLKYFPGLEPFGDILRGLVPDRINVRRTVDDKTEYHNPWDNFHGDELCVVLGTLLKQAWSGLPAKDICHYSGNFVQRVQLLLFREGQVVTWEWRAEDRISKIWHRRRETETYEIGIFSRLRILDDEELLQRLTGVAAVQSVVSTLRALAERNMSEREKRLKSSKRLVASLKGISC